MPSTGPIRIGKLFLSIEGASRATDANVPTVDELSVEVRVENSTRPLGEAGRAPEVEIRDGDGAVYEPVNLDRAWYTPHRPDTSATARLRFRIPVDATDLTFVLAPGTAEEAQVTLEPVLT